MDNRITRIRRQYHRLERKRDLLMKEVQSCSPEDYLRQPTPDQWSIGQVANHLFLSEKLSLGYLRKKLSYPETVPRFQFRSWWGIGLIKIVFFLQVKVKAPGPINMWEEQDVLSASALEEQWGQLREELISFIEQHDAAFGSHLAYRHPFAGRMTMYQMLIFLNDHMAHHLRQVRRTVRKIRSS
jgi:uncharacterized damage-inducible protein DinB